MIDDLQDLTAFARVVEEGSLSAAARKLNVSPAVISRRLARLESTLGVRLINRTTRALALTGEGMLFHARCLRVLAEVEEAEQEVTRGRDAATGLLRVTAPVAFGKRQLVRLLREFAEVHPGLRVQLDTTDAVVDIVDAGYDLAVRFGSLADSSLMTRTLATNRRVICGAPSYLERRGRPVAIADLREHDCIVYGDPPLDHWTFAKERSVRVKGRFASRDGETAHAWALAGAGLVMKSIWDVHEDVAAGRLEIVLPQWPLPAAAVHAVYPPGRHGAAKVRLCVEFLAHHLGEDGRRILNDMKQTGEMQP